MKKDRLIKLILPLILEQLLAISVGFADTFMVAKVSEQAVSGVSLVDSINVLVIQVIAAFASGGIVVISQYIGEKNIKRVREASRNLEILIDSFGALVMIIFLVFGRLILRLLFGRIETGVMNASITYMTVTSISLFFWGIYSSGTAILRSHEKTDISMIVSIFMNLLNVALNALFVLVFNWGVLGVAVATLISRGAAGIFMKIVLEIYIKKRYLDCFQETKPRGISFSMIKRILTVGVPTGIENGMFHVGKILLTSVIATLGTATITANAISFQIIEFPNVFGNVIGMAMIVIVGQEIGSGDKKRAFNNARSLMKIAYIGDWISKISLFVLAPFIIKIFPLETETQVIALQVLRWFSICSLPVWPLSFTLPKALQGAGDVKYSMIVSIISMWACRVAVSLILVKIFHFGILGVWIGMFADWYGRGISYLIRFRRGKWLDKKAV